MVSQKMQRKYVQLQLLKQELNTYVEQKNALDEKLNELAATVEALKRLESINKGDEIWSPFGSGAFVRSDIKDTERVLVAVGAGVVLREKRERAVEIIETRRKELEEADRQLMQEATKLAQQAAGIEKELELLAHEEENKEQENETPRKKRP